MFTRPARAHLSVSVIAAALVVVLAVAVPADAALTNSTPRGIRNCNPMSYHISSACWSGALSDFNAARAKEGLGRLVLPSNFRALTLPQQLLVLTNLDRRARGLAPFIGLSTTLNSYAARGANAGTDPQFPSWTREGGGNWSSTYNAFWTEYLWMYDDGIGSPNGACTRTRTTWCWAHRRNVLGSYAAPRVMGASANAKTGDAALYMGSDTRDTTFTFRWSSEARYFPGGRLP